MVAVQQDGTTVHLVKDQTPEVCMTAVQQDGWAIKLVKDANLRFAIKQVLIEESKGVDAPCAG